MAIVGALTYWIVYQKLLSSVFCDSQSLIVCTKPEKRIMKEPLGGQIVSTTPKHPPPCRSKGKRFGTRAIHQISSQRPEYLNHTI